MNKKIFVTKPSMPPLQEYVEQLKIIWNNEWLTNNGIMHNTFEDELKSYLQVDYTTLYVNGHLALDCAIKALNLNGEVITTPFTFVSTTHAIVMNGLTPVFCDIKMEDYTIDENKIESLINEKTTAILAVHVYGCPCNVEVLEKIARKHQLKLIYDAAHAFGVGINGKSIASYGDISMFSFHATKVFNSIEGGALVYEDGSLQKRLNQLKNFGIEGPEEIVDTGFNAKMNEFSAAMGLCNLKYLKEDIEIRKHITMLYNESLSDCVGIKILDTQKQNYTQNYAYFPILVDHTVTGFTRDELFNKLLNNDIFTRKYFYPLITKSECYHLKYGNVYLPVADYVSERVLTLPIYASLDDNDVERICNIIKAM